MNFKYDNTKILNNFSYTFELGKIYLIKGNNGSGKSSLIKNILGLYVDEYEGEILYNNIDVRKLDLYKLREEIIGVVEQEPNLISNTIYDEILLNLKNIDKNKIDKLIQDFNLENVYENNESKANEIKVSGGEKQKISIIRNISKNPNVLILDEPSSALDCKSIDILKDKLTNLKKEKITIIISHDSKMENLADHILNM